MTVLNTIEQLKAELAFQTARADILSDTYEYSEGEFFSPDMRIRELQWERMTQNPRYGLILFGMRDEYLMDVDYNKANKVYSEMLKRYHPDNGGFEGDLEAIEKLKRAIDLSKQYDM